MRHLDRPMLMSFESRVPPPLVALGTAIVMWLAFKDAPAPEALAPFRAFALTAAMQLSAVVVIAALASFWRVRTSINPLKPERASHLVTTGIYRFTRNPMYLSLLLLLISYTIRLGSLPAVLGPIAFAVYVTRFHIAPEERALEAKFGAEFLEYKRRVRRWL